jgi:hypothetical protein
MLIYDLTHMILPHQGLGVRYFGRSEKTSARRRCRCLSLLGRPPVKPQNTGAFRSLTQLRVVIDYRISETRAIFEPHAAMFFELRRGGYG